MKAVAIVVIAVGILGGFFIAAWLGGYVMLYQGICQAITAEGAAKAGPLLKAVFCEAGVFAGFAFGVLLVSGGLAVGQWRR
jgi:hypothetical protein